MKTAFPSPLARGDRRLLRVVRPVVPCDQREEWTRSWAAELWCSEHAARGAGSKTLFFGVVQDALWLRGEQVRQAVSGTALLCLSALLFLVGVSALPALSQTGGWRRLDIWFMGQGTRFLCESLLIVFVAYAIAPLQVEQAARRREVWVKARLFHFAKNLLVLVLAFNVSADLCFPFHAVVPLTSDFVQSMLFAFFALLGLRWSLEDDLTRCKLCLHALAAPERVGRPSHNFLEWNGTELLCSRGHGVLSVPELETSWCRASAWVTLDRP